MKMCRHPEDAEDVLQESLLAIARYVSGFKGASTFSTWIFSIARNFCIKKRRKSKFAPREYLSLDNMNQSVAVSEGSYRSDPFKQVEIVQAWQVVQSGMANLAPG